jgi:poly-gamma-glutamate synthesis protein (capsule biosynthesis protein)
VLGNFEGTLAEPGTWASSIDPQGVPICGGLNVRGDASVTGDLSWMGIDMLGTANNHAMDWGVKGMFATNNELTRAGIVHAGTGKDLASAREPAYFEAHGARTALISCASTYWPGALASHSNASIPGRPGLSPVRIVTHDNDANARTSVDHRDLDDILASVREAKRRADRVFVSCHTHESEVETDPDSAPAFLKELARACIEVGADSFFGHGPHVLRGVEIYHRKPIFYSLGSFIFRARETRPLPEEIYDNCEMTKRNPISYFDRTSREWEQDVEFWQSVIAKVQFDRDHVVEVNLIPTVLRHDAIPTWGIPRLADANEAKAILMRLRKLSEPFGTDIEIDDSLGRIRIRPN